MEDSVLECEQVTGDNSVSILESDMCWFFSYWYNLTSMCFIFAGIPPNKYHYIDDLVVIVPQNVWEYLYNR